MNWSYITQEGQCRSKIQSVAYTRRWCRGSHVTVTVLRKQVWSHPQRGFGKPRFMEESRDSCCNRHLSWNDLSMCNIMRELKERMSYGGLVIRSVNFHLFHPRNEYDRQEKRIYVFRSGKINFEVPKSWRLEKGQPVSTLKVMYSKDLLKIQKPEVHHHDYQEVRARMSPWKVRPSLTCCSWMTLAQKSQISCLISQSDFLSRTSR